MLERFVGKSKYPNHGQRVVAGQRLMQAASDIFLGWQRVTGLDGQVRDFYLRQLRDWKGSADVDTMASSLMTRTPGSAERPSPAPMPAPGTGSPSRPTWATSDTFDRAIADFSAAYADQNERDYRGLGRRREVRPPGGADRDVSPGRPGCCPMSPVVSATMHGRLTGQLGSP